jgi:hypothetical protein
MASGHSDEVHGFGGGQVLRERQGRCEGACEEVWNRRREGKCAEAEFLVDLLELRLTNV